MKKKKALQIFIHQEEERLKGIDPREQAFNLYYDDDFFKKHGRKRKPKEIALIMNYSERQIRRFLDNKKED